MARLNDVMLLGYLKSDPQIYKDREGKNYYATIRLVVVRGERSVGDGRKHTVYEEILLMTRNEEIMREMEEHLDVSKRKHSPWVRYDIIEVKGVLTERTIKKGAPCPYCQTKTKIPGGSLVYVTPIFAKRRKHRECDISDEEGVKRAEKACIEFLVDNQEVSNMAKVCGNLCREPKKIQTMSGRSFAQYQIALNRKYFIKGDNPEVTADYPWVKSYGENGERDLKHLHTGSEVLIDGCLQRRTIKRHAICGQEYDSNGKPRVDGNGEPVLMKDGNENIIGCGQKFDWEDKVLELVPYSVEYLNNFYSDEEVAEIEEQKRAEEAAAAYKRIFGDLENEG